MDDAFAGGVCRCRFCGTIQTVPSKLKDRNGSKHRTGSKAIYAKSARGEAIPSSGLDQLAQVVASSGLVSDRLRDETLGRQTKPSKQRLMLLVAGAILALGLLIGGWFALKSGSTTRQAGPLDAGLTGRGDNVSGTDSHVPPNFCEIPLHERTVVYVLDRGGSAVDLFSFLKEVTYKSVESLGTDRKFQIIFWNNGADDAYPASPTHAQSHSIEAARRTLDGIYAQGQTDVGSALKLAIQSRPDVIILATAKGWQLDHTFIDQVMGIRKDLPIKIHTVTLGGSEQSEALKTIALRTGGESRLVTEAELRRMAR
jgi:hypothetical protein